MQPPQGRPDIWKELDQKLPWHKDETSRLKRQEQWRQIDINGNNYLSLAELDKGMRDVIRLPILFDSKPVLMRAFQSARIVLKGKSATDDDFVTPGEYRLLLKYLR